MKKIMVDLDDTIVAFSEMFVNKCNSLVSKYYDIHKRLKIEDITDYSFMNGFLEVFDELSQVEYSRILQEIFSDVTLYQNSIYTRESHTIFNMLERCKRQGYKLILNTKVSTYAMIESKTSLFRADKRFEMFDEIILDMERGEHSPKSFEYDYMVDDAPHNIEYYLNNNPQGIVYMPLRPWNEKFKDNERVIIL